MSTVGRRLVLGAALAVAAAGVVIAAGAEDDLAVVKRAVAGQQVARQETPANTPPTADEPITRVREKGDLRWFKVRIIEKGSKKARVTVNLPIALVRALGDDFPIDIGRHAGWRGERERTLRLGEVLATLEAGQSLVEIDDDESTVRVWVE